MSVHERSHAAPSLHFFVLRAFPRQDVPPNPHGDLAIARALATSAWADLRARGLRVTLQHDYHALEVLATDEQAACALQSGFFHSYSRGAVDPGAFRDDRGRRVAALWNTRFDPAYRRQYHDHVPKEARELAAQEPRTVSHALRSLLERAKKARQGLATLSTEKSAFIQSIEPALPTTPPTMCAIHCSSLRVHEAKLHGRIVVAIVLVQLTNAPAFADARQHRILREALDGLAWLVAQHPDGNLTFVVRVETPTAVDPPAARTPSPLSDVLARTRIALDGEERGASASLTDFAYLTALNTTLGGVAAKLIALTPFAGDPSWATGYTNGNTWITYLDDWRGHGDATVDGIVAHEFLHNFGADDEYPRRPGRSGCECTSDEVAKTKIPNGNCAACRKSPQERCIMRDFSRTLCPHTRAQVGWADLFVELQTAGAPMAGTDDRLWLDIGDRVLALDAREHDDHEPMQTAGYCFWGVRRDEVKRILLRKEPGDLAGAWLPTRVRVWHRHTLLCDLRNDERRWLDDEVTCWTAPAGFLDRDYVSKLEVDLRTSGHRGSRAVRLWIDDRSWVLPCPKSSSLGVNDRFLVDPGMGLRRSSIRIIGIEWVRNHFDDPAPAVIEALEIRCNDATVLEAKGPFERGLWTDRSPELRLLASRQI